MIGPPVIGGFTYILQHTGPYVPLYLWAFFFALQIFFLTVRPPPAAVLSCWCWWSADVAEHGVTSRAGLPPRHCPAVQQVLAPGCWLPAVGPRYNLHSDAAAQCIAVVDKKLSSITCVLKADD